MKTMAIILAGGKGKRMGKLCHQRPKPALPFFGEYRVIDFSLSNCINSGMTNILVLTDYLHSYLGSYLDAWRSVYSREREFNIVKPRIDHYQGTADAVYQNLESLENSDAEKILVLAADHVYKMDYRDMLNFHEQEDADVTIGVAPVDSERASHFGIVKTDKVGRITGFIEKPSVPPGNLASMGIYLFNKEFLVKCLKADATNVTSSHDFGYDIIPSMMKNNNNAFAYRFDGYWQDIGTPRAYLEANLELASDKPPINLNSGWIILTAGGQTATQKKYDHGWVSDSLVADGCSIEGKVQKSVLSPGVRIARGAVVRNSVLMRNVSIGPGSLVEYAILDEGVVIGESCKVGQTANGVTVLEESCMVPSFTYHGYEQVDRVRVKDKPLPICV